MKNLKKKNIIVVIIAILVIIIAAKFLFFSSGQTINYLTTTVVRQNIENHVLANGVIKPYKLVSVGAQATGQIKALNVKVGDYVKMGELVAEIDDLTQRNQLKENKASLAVLQAQRKAKEATLKNMQLTYQRQKKLMDREVGSQSALDTAITELDVTKAEILALDANIDKAIINVDNAELNLSYTKIAAPMDGVIVAIPVEEGQTVNSVQSAPTIVKVAQLDKMMVEAEISEADVIKIDEDKNELYFTILGLEDKPFTGLKLESIKPAPESINNDNYLTVTSSSNGEAIYYHGIFYVDNKEGILRPSMSAQVYIILDKAENVLTIPSTAIQQKLSNDEVMVYKIVNGKPQETIVKIGIDNNVTAEVVSGLDEGDEVIDGRFNINKKSSGQLKNRK